MATAPKAAPKAAPEEAAAEAPKKPKKKLIMIAAIALVVAGGGGGAAWYLTKPSANAMALGAEGEAPEKANKPAPGAAPIYIVLEPFTVNLQQESGEQFLQIALTFQVADQAQVETFKTYMPQVRSRLLLLLSGKKASEISTTEGKKQLADEVIAAMKLPLTANGPSQQIFNVFFTSLVIQ